MRVGDYCILGRDSTGGLIAIPVSISPLDGKYCDLYFVFTGVASSAGAIYKRANGIQEEVYIVFPEPIPVGFTALMRLSSGFTTFNSTTLAGYTHAAGTSLIISATMSYRYIYDDYEWGSLTWADRPLGDEDTEREWIYRSSGLYLSAAADAAMNGKNMSHSLTARPYNNAYMQIRNNGTDTIKAIRLFVSYLDSEISTGTAYFYLASTTSPQVLNIFM